MADILDPLWEVVRKWRSYHHSIASHRAAEIIESMLPAIEEKIAALTEKMACGHPKALQPIHPFAQKRFANHVHLPGRYCKGCADCFELDARNQALDAYVQEQVDRAVLTAIESLQRCVLRVCPDQKAALHEASHRAAESIEALLPALAQRIEQIEDDAEERWKARTRLLMGDGDKLRAEIAAKDKELAKAVLAESEAMLTHKFGVCRDARNPVMCAYCDRVAANRAKVKPDAPAAPAAPADAPGVK